MQHDFATAAPRRSLIWDEATATYIWLDPIAKQAAANLRAKREADALLSSLTSGAYSCALGDLWDSADYDTESSRRRTAAAWREKNRNRHAEYARRSRAKRKAALAGINAEPA